MIKVTVGNNLRREAFMFEPATTINEIINHPDIQEKFINTNTNRLTLSGSTIFDNEFGKTLEELHVSDSCTLLNIAKADNGSF